jgi:monoamine oxidase
MDSELYQRAGLDVKLTLDKPLSMAEINELEKAMEDRVLRPIALMAKALIRDPSQPWLQDILRKFDGLTVQEALPKFCKIAKRTTGNKDERLWKMLEFKLVNDEVAPLDKMNFLGLLCKVKAGQGERLGTDKSNLMGYWNELEIFRCADGCQQLARALERAEIQDKTGRQTYLNTAVTAIDIMKQGAQVTWAPVVNGMPVPGHGKPALFDFVVLAIPPSVWDDVPIKADGKVVRLKDEIGDMGMEPAVKFFSDVKERFWIKEHAAPYGGALALGQVWEGTDNQTRTGDQSIVLSVFAGPILPGGLAPAEKDFKKGLQDLYRGYSSNSKPNGTFLADWPNRRFIMTGYASPRTNQVFSIGRKLSEPFRDRLSFAGEHTHMAFFGYMEGALRSGERAAHALIRKACGLMQERVPAPVMRTVRATPVRKEIA